MSAAAYLYLSGASPSPEILLARQLGAEIATGVAPAFDVEGRDGTSISLSAFRGRVALVHFWATWCPPCREEIPDLQRLTQRLRGHDVDIVAISSDESWPDIDAFFGGQPPLMHLGLDVTKSVAGRYGTSKFPETYVVDRGGNLRLRFINAQPWTDQRIVEYLKRLTLDD